MTVRTPWIDGALGEGEELREADARFNTTSVARSTKNCPGFEIQVTGELSDVVTHVMTMWESGTEVDDLEMLQWVVKEITIVDTEAEARAAEAKAVRLAEAEAVLTAARRALYEAEAVFQEVQAL